MITLGITGRSGCGKSTVTAWLVRQGIPCIDADQTARQVLEPGSVCLTQIRTAFGDGVFHGEALDRHKLADFAFATPERTQKLSAITHPEIIRRIKAAQQAAQHAGAWLFCVDAAILIGSAFAPCCDKILVVTAPYAISVQRICTRDGISPEMAARRLAAQISEQQLLQQADYVIENNSTPQALIEKAAGVFHFLREGALHESQSQ